MNKPPLRVVEGGNMDKQKALEAALAQIDKNFGKGSIMRLGRQRPHHGRGGHLDGLARPRHRARHRRPAARARDRDLRARILRQDHAGPAGRGGSPEKGRHLRVRRCRARARPRLCQEARRQGRGSADLPARRRRAGARDRRHAGALGRRRRAGGGFGCSPHPQGRARGRDGRHAARHAGAPDEQGAQEAHRLDLQVEVHGDLHQPDPHEDRHHVRQPRDHHRRQRAQVLRQRAPRHPPHRPDQGARGGGRQPDARQGRQEQGGAALQAGRVRHHVRGGHLQDRRARRSRRQGRHHREVGRLVLLRRRAHRPGPREHQGVPQGASQGRRPDREGGAPERRADRRQDAAGSARGRRGRRRRGRPRGLHARGRAGGRRPARAPRASGNVVSIPEVAQRPSGTRYQHRAPRCPDISLRESPRPDSAFVDSADTPR